MHQLAFELHTDYLGVKMDRCLDIFHHQAYMFQLFHSQRNPSLQNAWGFSFIVEDLAQKVCIVAISGLCCHTVCEGCSGNASTEVTM
jgi:hypothetical protein